MKGIKELRKWLIFEEYNEEAKAYYDWYKDAIEWILEDIRDSGVISVESIEKYLQDLLNN